MMRILIFGNSGAGKSTLAKELTLEHGLAHLDLDELAWLPTNPPERAPLKSSNEKIAQFTKANNGWVIEGCYTDLLALVVEDATEAIFLNVSISDCIRNAQSRPWEPHKYESKEAQDQNLKMLVSWIEEYQERTDSFSFASHLEFYENFMGSKVMYHDNERRLR